VENVLEWEAIADDFTDVLCLGNGASIALAEEFSYRSLLEEARKQELITEDLDELFEYLGTEDFELVLNLLWHAVHVNRALDISEDRTEEAYEAVRHALVQSVRENHADHADVVERLPSAYQFLKRFGTVHSLNYDLVLYWAMMAGNDELGNWFKDCFVRGSFHKNWEQFRRPHRAKGATLVFYPHGNLSLATSLRGEDQKVHREDDWDDLLYRITEQWNDGDLAPLFVTEGIQTKRSSRFGEAPTSVRYTIRSCQIRPSPWSSTGSPFRRTTSISSVSWPEPSLLGSRCRSSRETVRTKTWRQIFIASA